MSTDLVVTTTLIGEADDLAVAHEHFTTHYVVGGRFALYELLGQMLELANKFEAAIDREDLIANIKYRLRSEFGIKTQKNTSDIAALIRYITRADRKTAHVYTRVLESAKQNGISPAQLPQFIEGAGGVERIRALRSNQSEASIENDASDYAALTEEYLSCREELPLASFETTEFLDEITFSNARYSYFICARKADGKFYVLAPIPATAEFERDAIDRLSKAICEDTERPVDGVSNLRRKPVTTSKTSITDVVFLETADCSKQI